MFTVNSKTPIYLTLDPQDLRKSFNGLGVIAQEQCRITDSALHLFTNKARNRVKILHFDGTGIWCAAKKLEQGVFNWPTATKSDQTVLKLSPQALQLLLDGVDLRNGTLRPWFEAK